MNINKVVNYVKLHINFLTEGIFLVVIYVVCQLPLRDFDIWFHLKSGELFVTEHAIKFTEVFSYSAQGRAWTPFEWLFQITVYLLSKIGLWIIPPFIGIFVVLMFFFFLRILSSIFKLSLIPRIFLAFAFFVSIYEFNTARPHVLAYAFVCLNLFLIFSRIYRNKKWIYATPLITLIWANWHSTGFLSWGLQFSYASILFFQFIISRDKKLLPVVRDLVLLTILNLIVTLLPPLGIKDYQLLLDFYKDQDFLSKFIAEWAPIKENPYGFWTYTVTLAITVLSFIVVTIKRKAYLEFTLVLPLILMAAMSYSASRNIVMGSLATYLILAWSLKYLLEWSKISIIKFVWIPILIIGIGFYAYTFSVKRDEVYNARFYYPVQSTEFVKRYLKGNMFNDYTYGGYILNEVYPTLKVFIDGRADVFHLHEMRDYLLLSVYKNESDEEYKKFLDELWEKYDVSFVIATTLKHNVWRKMSKIISNDPKWALVFWDDDSQVFVKRDGVNDEIIKEMEAKYATPYLKTPFDKSKADEALVEYQKMENIAPSARNENSIGFILAQKGDFDTARNLFYSAIDKDPSFESSYMNLGELYAKDGDLDKAISLYYKAQNKANDRGLIYIRLGQLILARDGESGLEKVRNIWQLGVKNTVDDDAKKQLEDLLKTL